REVTTPCCWHMSTCWSQSDTCAALDGPRRSLSGRRGETRRLISPRSYACSGWWCQPCAHPGRYGEARDSRFRTLWVTADESLMFYDRRLDPVATSALGGVAGGVAASA